MGNRVKIAHDSDGTAEPKTKRAEPSTGEPPRKRFVVEARPLGLRHDLNFDKIEELLDEIEGPLRR
jgi:hypothetical protein